MTMKIANRLTALRKQNGLSQEELAGKIGVSRQAVSKWERAESSPDTDNLITLARLYHVSLDEMLGEEEAVAPNSSSDAGGKPETKAESAPGPAAPPTLTAPPADRPQESQGDARSAWHWFPFSSLVVLVFFLIGFLFNAWDFAWLVFLTIPVYYGFARFWSGDRRPGDAGKEPARDGKSGADEAPSRMYMIPFASIATLIYLALGFIGNWWSTAWLVFLCIPVVVGIVRFANRR